VFVRYAGLGQHWAALSPQAITNHLKLELSIIFIYIPAVCLPKLAILTLYLRIFTSKLYRYASYAVAAVPILTAFVSAIIAFAMCRPFAYNWDKNIQGGYCIDKWRVYTWISLPNIVTDVAMLLLPIPVIWRLQMSRNQKIGLTITLMTGSM
jgi:ABC-type sulfate transport system permease component